MIPDSVLMIRWQQRHDLPKFPTFPSIFKRSHLIHFQLNRVFYCLCLWEESTMVGCCNVGSFIRTWQCFLIKGSGKNGARTLGPVGSLVLSLTDCLRNKKSCPLWIWQKVHPFPFPFHLPCSLFQMSMWNKSCGFGKRSIWHGGLILILN